MQARGQSYVVALAAGTAAVVLGGCLQPADEPGNQVVAREPAVVAAVQPVSLAGRPTLRGGDSQAWLTTAGDIADSNFCRAEVSFPLDPQPVWEYQYTAARFSFSAASTMLHYDGLLVVAARSSQVLGLDAATGEEVFNQDVYLHGDDQNQEQIARLVFHPAGLLFGADELGRFYCWDIIDGRLEQQWVAATADGYRAMVAAGPGIYATWDDQLHGLAVSDGTEDWAYPSLAEEGGLILADNGLLVAWTSLGEFHCVDSSDGAMQWSVFTNTEGRDWATRALVSNERGEVFFVLPDERLQCRDLATGELNWEYCWTDLLPLEERFAHFESHGADPIPLWAIECQLTPTGVSLALLHGQVVSIDYTGQPRWTYDSDVLIIGGGAFNNAVMLTEWYLGTEYQRQINPGWRTFITEPPEDWRRYREADERRQANGSFQRFVWLDPLDGHTIETFEPDYPVNTIIPAGDKMVIGESMRNDTNTRRVLAYNWLIREED